MSMVDALRDKAEQARAQLADALRDAEQADAERKARNAARRAEFWTDAGTRVQAAQQATTQARRAVVDATAAGDLADAQAAYVEYLRRHTEQATVVALAQAETGAYVWTERQQVDPSDKPGKRGEGYHRPQTVEVERRVLAKDWTGLTPANSRLRYAEGVPVQSMGDPETFDKLRGEGLQRLREQHAAEFRATYLQPLIEQLEPED